MEYEFHILTKIGIVKSNVMSDYDFIDAPFGSFGYKHLSSSTCSQDVINAFWNCVDEVLSNHSMSSVDFIKAIRAYRNGKLIGEFE